MLKWIMLFFTRRPPGELMREAARSMNTYNGPPLPTLWMGDKPSNNGPH